MSTITNYFWIWGQITNWRDSWKNRIYWYISFFSAHHSIVFCFRYSVYWWKRSVRFACFKILL